VNGSEVFNLWSAKSFCHKLVPHASSNPEEVRHSFVQGDVFGTQGWQLMLASLASNNLKSPPNPCFEGVVEGPVLILILGYRSSTQCGSVLKGWCRFSMPCSRDALFS
jgi:hypothetical protein